MPANHAGHFGSPEKPGGRPLGARNKRHYADIAKFFNRAAAEGFNCSEEDAILNMCKFLLQQLVGNKKEGRAPDPKYLPYVLPWWWGKPPENLASREALEDAAQQLAEVAELRKTG